MDNFKTHEEKSPLSSNPKWLRYISSYFPCTTSEHLKKNIHDGIEGNSHEGQVLVDILYDVEDTFEETFEDESSSSQLKQSYCAICMEVKHVNEMFENGNCSHSFCEDCVGSYLVTKIQENIAMIKCPEPKCNDILEPYDCISIIPKDVFERWENVLVENLVLGSQKFYCPFNDCSAMLVNDGKKIVTDSECPHCHRLFCAQCKVSWHAGVDCREFQSLNLGDRGREDLMAMELAKNKKWKKCPKCFFYVEKNGGCNRIRCRCGHTFYYEEDVVSQLVDTLLPFLFVLTLCVLGWIKWSSGYSLIETFIYLLIYCMICFAVGRMGNFLLDFC